MGQDNQFHWAQRLIGGGVPIPADTVSANMLGRVVTAAVLRGAKRPDLLNTIGVTERTIRNQLSRVPGQVLVRLITAAEQQTGNPALALEIGRDSAPICFSDIGYATRLLPNLYQVIDANLAMQELRQNMYRAVLEEAESSTFLRWDLQNHRAADIAPVIEFSIATYIRLAREIWPDSLTIEAIHMRHAARFAPDLYERILGHSVQFGCPETKVAFSTLQCRAASPLANRTLLEAASRSHALPVEWFDQGKKLAAFTYFYVFTEMNKSPVTLERIARSFGMAERTLRRHLVEEGHPFRLLLDTARKSLCDLYKLENRRSLGEVAELLGYGELSAFTRAYRRWYGVAPSRDWKS